MEGQIAGQRRRSRSRIVGAWFAVVLAVGFAANVLPPAVAGVVQEGDNEGEIDQSGEVATGDAVAGQVVGIASSGDVSVDAKNQVEDADAQTGDAEGSNSVKALVGDNVTEECLEPQGGAEAQQVCPDEFVGVAIEAASIGADIVHAGDNELEIDQSARATTGDAIAGGQVVGVTAAGIVDIVLDNQAEDVDAESGDAEANNVINDAQVGDFVEFLCSDCTEPGAAAIDVTTITAVIVHDGDNELDIDQTAIASTGDAVAGSQVVGVVTTATGDVSIDARNRANDAAAETGDAEAENFIDQAVAGETVLGAPCCDGLNGNAVAAGIEANQIDAAIIHAGDNELDIGQTANASSGDAVAASQVVGAVGAGEIDIVLDNVGINADAKSGDAEASNDIDTAQSGDFVGFACEECPLPVEEVGVSSIEASTITAVIVHDGDNETSIDQTALASSGDAVAGSQVVGAVASPTGDISIDARNRGEDVEAETGDAEAENEIGEAIAGDTVLDAPCEPCEVTDQLAQAIEADQIDAVIVHAGDNELSIDQTANASSGDAVSGSQVIGTVGAGEIDIVADNEGIDTEAESGDAEAHNEVVDAEAGNFVDFLTACPDCPPPPGVNPVAIEVTTITAVIVQDGDNELDIDQTATALSGDAVAGSQVIGAVASLGGDISIDARNRAEDAEAETGDADADNLIGSAVAGNAVFDAASVTGTIESGDNELTIDQTADASSGDAVAGAQIVGAIGGNVDAVLDNTGLDLDTETGDAETTNEVPSAQAGASFEGTTPTGASVAVTGLTLLGLASLAVTRLGRRGRRAGGRKAEPTHEVTTGASADEPTTRQSRPVSARRVATAGLIVLGGMLLARRLGRR